MPVTTIWTEDCVVCHRRPSDARCYPQVCPYCRAGLRSDLAGIPGAYVELARELVPGVTRGPRISGTRDARLPAALDVLNLRSGSGTGVISRWYLEDHHLPTQHLADQHGPIPVAGILSCLERDIREEMGWTAPVFRGTVEQAVRSTVGWMLGRLDVICDVYPAAEEFISAVAAVGAECRRVIGSTPRRLGVGPCPMVLADGTVCGHGRSVDPYGDAMRCGGCGTKWKRWEWMALAAMVAEEGCA